MQIQYKHKKYKCSQISHDLKESRLQPQVADHSFKSLELNAHALRL